MKMTEIKWPEGEEFHLDIQHGTQERIDSAKVREKFADDPDTLSSLIKEVPTRTIRTNRKDPQKKPKFDAPNLQNATPEFLIDELGKVREKQNELKRLEGIYKEALESRINKLIHEAKK